MSKAGSRCGKFFTATMENCCFTRGWRSGGWITCESALQECFDSRCGADKSQNATPLRCTAVVLNRFSDVPSGQYFVCQVLLDCNHEHNNKKRTYNYRTFTLKFPCGDTLKNSCAAWSTFAYPIWKSLRQPARPGWGTCFSWAAGHMRPASKILFPILCWICVKVKRSHNGFTSWSKKTCVFGCFFMIR